jgi:uncharacterized membrane protein YfcA
LHQFRLPTSAAWWSTHVYKPLVGVVLIYAAWQSYRSAPHSVNASIRPVSTWVLALVGALLGGLSGLTGVGGGIFLSPLLILCRWASTKVVSGISAERRAIRVVCRLN